MPATSTDALFLIDKPAGVTSHDVVAMARRAIATRKVGHSGTLDPFATGLLVLLAGRGTRLLRFVPGEPKLYEALITFGHETDTDDATGSVTGTAAIPGQEAVTRGIAALTGSLAQRPPAYSAKHIDGQRAYDLARRGIAVSLPEVAVQVHGWEILGYEEGRLHARISCGSGTYIRALARDLGRLAESAAHLSALRRLRVGPFDVADADDADALRAGRLRPHPLVAALSGWPCEGLSEEEARRASHGMRVPARLEATRAVLLRPDGDVLAVALRVGDEWQPEVVLSDA